jgi:phage terminase small subunit
MSADGGRPAPAKSPRVVQLKAKRAEVRDSRLPRHLRAATRRWAEGILDGFEFESHHVRLLVLACQAWDQGERARARLARHGVTYLDRFRQPRIRPEVKVEHDARIAFARILRELRLDSTEGPESRPPALGDR